MNGIELIELLEVVEKLKETEHRELVEMILEGECFTVGRGRFNKSKASRLMGCRTQDMEKMMGELKEITEGLVG